MGNARQKYTDEEWEQLGKENVDCQNIRTPLKTSIGDENFDFSRTSENLMDKYAEYKQQKLNPLNCCIKVKEAREYVTTTTINTDMSRTTTKELKDSAKNKGFFGDQVGAKYSDDKAPMGIMLRQFPLALQGVAQRSLYGHNKYKEFDHDWMNFKRNPDAINQYLNATVRHLAEIGGDEDSLEHLKAAAWNILATLQITLESK